MSYIEINDDVIWAKHVHGDSALQKHILDAPQGAIIHLELDGHLTHWVKMRDDPSGRPTNGIRPTKTSLAAWREIRKKNRGTLLHVTSHGHAIPSGRKALQKQLDPEQLDGDIHGNNAAVTCPRCRKVYVVSAHIDRKNGRSCPKCGGSLTIIEESGGQKIFITSWDGV